MNSGASKPRRGNSTSAEPPDWRRQLDDWRNLLVECARKPTRKRIHMLRVATLRLQAQVRYWLDSCALHHPAEPIAKRWNKEAKHLRRALGSVRTYDVHLAKLSQLRGLLTADSGYEPHSCRTTLRQIEDLETRFGGARKKSAKDLKDALVTRHQQCERAATDLAATPEISHELLQSLTADRLSAMLVEAASVFSPDNPESLHDFRKRLKSVRYLSELAVTSPYAVEIAATVKSMQGAIGEWHDWEELSIYARRLFRRKDAPELSGELETLMKHSLEKALAMCTRITRENLSGSSTGQAPPKKTVLRENMPGTRKDTAVA